MGSRLLFEGLDSLGLDVANVAGRDLLLGEETLVRLEDSFGGAFVSANVTVEGIPRFDTHVVLERQVQGRPVRIGITGVTLPSRAASESWQQGTLAFTDPMQAARRMAEELMPGTDLRILLTNLAVVDLENFVAEFPEAYQILVSGNGEMRNTTPLGAPPFVLAPGTSGKQLAWVNMGWGPDDELEVTAGSSVTLDEKIGDDPEFATLVDDLRRRMLLHLQDRRESMSGAPERAETPVPADIP